MTDHKKTSPTARQHAKHGEFRVSVRDRRMNIIEMLEDIASKRAGREVSYEKISDTYKKYLQAQKGSEIKQIVENDVENLPFGFRSGGPTGVGSIGIGAASANYLVPVEMPSLLDWADENFHPPGFPEWKKGPLDAIVSQQVAGIPALGDAKYGDRWRYIKEELELSTGKRIPLKDADGNLLPIRKRTPVYDQLKKINDQYESLQEAVKAKKHPKYIKLKKDAFLREVEKITNTDLFTRDVNSEWRWLKEQMKKGNVEMAIVNFRGKDELEVHYKKHGVNWTMKMKLTKSGNAVKVGKAINFFGVADPDALKKAQKLMNNLELTAFRYALLTNGKTPSASKGGMVKRLKRRTGSRMKAFFFNKRQVKLHRGRPFVTPMHRAASFRSLFLGGFGGALFDGFLEGVTALSEGASVTDALKRAANRAEIGFVFSTATGLTLKVLTMGVKKYIAKRAERQAKKAALKQAAKHTGKGVVKKVGKKLATRLGTKVIPVAGWVLTAWEIGWTAGRVLNNVLMKEHRNYEAQCRMEFYEVEKAWLVYPRNRSERERERTRKLQNQYLAEYFDVEPGLEIRRPRWKFTGRKRIRPGWNLIKDDGTVVPGSERVEPYIYSYETVPRSVRVEFKNGTIVEYGEEVLLPSSSYPPFCPYLPEMDKASKNRYKKIKRNLRDIRNELNELRESTEWASDGMTGVAAKTVGTIEACKVNIAMLDSLHLSTKWAYYRTPGKSEMYYWVDHTGQPYSWAGTEGDFESDPEKAREAIDMMEKIREDLGIS